MTLWQKYHLPATVNDALSLMQRYDGQALFVAGGTDLMLDLEYGNHPPVAALVDVTKIAGLNEIREEGDWILIGAAVTHAQIESDPRIRRYGAALAESSSVVGGPQVRNVATIGGNVAHALPAADGTIGLLTLDAEVQVCTRDGDKTACEWRPLLSIFAGPGRNNLAVNQMLAGFRFRKAGPRQASAFDRIMRPQGVALPILGVAARLTLDESLTRIAAAAIAIGPAGPIPFRATEAEAVLTQAAQFDEDAVEAAIAAAQAQARLRTSKHRATKEYRHEMIAVLLRRVLNRAADAAKANVG
jgi:carbon-monoxide dehydrogenase medium subunit